MKDYELLEKQCEMMRLAEKHGIDDWRKLVRVEMHKSGRISMLDIEAKFTETPKCNYKSWALGVVEGRPVFEGDELYWKNDGRSLSVNKDWGSWSDWADMSWNPPAPKTVMIELLVEDAKWAVTCYTANHEPSNRVKEACRKALESINKP